MHLEVGLGVPDYDFSACTYFMKKCTYIMYNLSHIILYMYKRVHPKMYMHKNQTYCEVKNAHVQNKLYIMLCMRLPIVHLTQKNVHDIVHEIVQEDAKKGTPQIASRIALVNGYTRIPSQLGGGAH